MQETVAWLRSMEELARDVYRVAAAAHAQDPALHGFLSSLADDEACHAQILSDVSVNVSGASAQSALEVAVDAETGGRIEGALREVLSAAQRTPPDPERLLESIVTVERSELNDIFMYVVGTLGAGDPDLREMGSTVDAHERRIVEFLQSRPGGARFVEEARSLPQVWRPRFLVVEDSELVAEFFKAILEREGTVEVAENGKDALQKTWDGYFDGILCDVRMPVMDGPTFLEKARARDPEIVKRFVFCTGDPPPSLAEVLRETGIPCLEKPVTVSQLLATLLPIARRESRC